MVEGMHLTDRFPQIGEDELITALVPPPRFDGVRFTTYVPNPDEPSQAEAVTSCAAFAGRISAGAVKKSRLRGLFGSAPEPVGEGDQP